MDASLQELARAPFPSPLGPLHLVFAGETLLALDFVDNDARLARILAKRFPHRTTTPAPLPVWLAEPLEAYFAGFLEPFRDLALLTGGTPFQREVWRYLQQLPAGETATYGAIATALNKPPSASRAVGAAVGANPIAIIIPCHRIVGAKGKLTGYAGGLERKRWLLQHEGWAREGGT